MTTPQKARLRGPRSSSQETNRRGECKNEWKRGMGMILNKCSTKKDKGLSHLRVKKIEIQLKKLPEDDVDQLLGRTGVQFYDLSAEDKNSASDDISSNESVSPVEFPAEKSTTSLVNSSEPNRTSSSESFCPKSTLEVPTTSSTNSSSISIDTNLALSVITVLEDNKSVPSANEVSQPNFLVKDLTKKYVLPQRTCTVKIPHNSKTRTKDFCVLLENVQVSSVKNSVACVCLEQSMSYIHVPENFVFEPRTLRSKRNSGIKSSSISVRPDSSCRSPHINTEPNLPSNLKLSEMVTKSNKNIDDDRTTQSFSKSSKDKISDSHRRHLPRDCSSNSNSSLEHGNNRINIEVPPNRTIVNRRSNVPPLVDLCQRELRAATNEQTLNASNRPPYSLSDAMLVPEVNIEPTSKAEESMSLDVLSTDRDNSSASEIIHKIIYDVISKMTVEMKDKCDSSPVLTNQSEPLNITLTKKTGNKHLPTSVLHEIVRQKLNEINKRIEHSFLIEKNKSELSSTIMGKEGASDNSSTEVPDKLVNQSQVQSETNDKANSLPLIQSNQSKLLNTLVNGEQSTNDHLATPVLSELKSQNQELDETNDKHNGSLIIDNIQSKLSNFVTNKEHSDENLFPPGIKELSSQDQNEECDKDNIPHVKENKLAKLSSSEEQASKDVALPVLLDKSSNRSQDQTGTRDKDTVLHLEKNNPIESLNGTMNKECADNDPSISIPEQLENQSQDQTRISDKDTVLHLEKNNLIESSNGMIESSNGMIESSNGMIKSSNGMIESSNGTIESSNGTTNKEYADNDPSISIPEKLENQSQDQTGISNKDTILHLEKNNQIDLSNGTMNEECADDSSISIAEKLANQSQDQTRTSDKDTVLSLEINNQIELSNAVTKEECADNDSSISIAEKLANQSQDQTRTSDKDTVLSLEINNQIELSNAVTKEECADNDSSISIAEKLANQSQDQTRTSDKDTVLSLEINNQIELSNAVTKEECADNDSSISIAEKLANQSQDQTRTSDKDTVLSLENNNQIELSNAVTKEECADNDSSISIAEKLANQSQDQTRTSDKDTVLSLEINNQIELSNAVTKEECADNDSSISIAEKLANQSQDQTRTRDKDTVLSLENNNQIELSNAVTKKECADNDSSISIAEKLANQSQDQTRTSDKDTILSLEINNQIELSNAVTKEECADNDSSISIAEKLTNQSQDQTRTSDKDTVLSLENNNQIELLNAVTKEECADDLSIPIAEKLANQNQDQIGTGDKDAILHLEDNNQIELENGMRNEECADNDSSISIAEKLANQSQDQTRTSDKDTVLSLENNNQIEISNAVTKEECANNDSSIPIAEKLANQNQDQIGTSDKDAILHLEDNNQIELENGMTNEECADNDSSISITEKLANQSQDQTRTSNKDTVLSLESNNQIELSNAVTKEECADDSSIPIAEKLANQNQDQIGTGDKDVILHLEDNNQIELENGMTNEECADNDLSISIAEKLANQTQDQTGTSDKDTILHLENNNQIELPNSMTNEKCADNNSSISIPDKLANQSQDQTGISDKDVILCLENNNQIELLNSMTNEECANNDSSILIAEKLANQSQDQTETSDKDAILHLEDNNQIELENGMTNEECADNDSCISIPDKLANQSQDQTGTSEKDTILHLENIKQTKLPNSMMNEECADNNSSISISDKLANQSKDQTGTTDKDATLHIEKSKQIELSTGMTNEKCTGNDLSISIPKKSANQNQQSDETDNRSDILPSMKENQPELPDPITNTAHDLSPSTFKHLINENQEVNKETDITDFSTGIGINRPDLSVFIVNKDTGYDNLQESTSQSSLSCPEEAETSNKNNVSFPKENDQPELSDDVTNKEYVDNDLSILEHKKVANTSQEQDETDDQNDVSSLLEDSESELSNSITNNVHENDFSSSILKDLMNENQEVTTGNDRTDFSTFLDNNRSDLSVIIIRNEDSTHDDLPKSISQESSKSQEQDDANKDTISPINENNQSKLLNDIISKENVDNGLSTSIHEKLANESQEQAETDNKNDVSPLIESNEHGLPNSIFSEVGQNDSSASILKDPANKNQGANKTNDNSDSATSTDNYKSDLSIIITDKDVEHEELTKSHEQDETSGENGVSPFTENNQFELSNIITNKVCSDNTLSFENCLNQSQESDKTDETSDDSLSIGNNQYELLDFIINDVCKNDFPVPISKNLESEKQEESEANNSLGILTSADDHQHDLSIITVDESTEYGNLPKSTLQKLSESQGMDEKFELLSAEEIRSLSLSPAISRDTASDHPFSVLDELINGIEKQSDTSDDGFVVVDEAWDDKESITSPSESNMTEDCDILYDSSMTDSYFAKNDSELGKKGEDTDSLAQNVSLDHAFKIKSTSNEQEPQILLMNEPLDSKTSSGSQLVMVQQLHHIVACTVTPSESEEQERPESLEISSNDNIKELLASTISLICHTETQLANEKVEPKKAVDILFSNCNSDSLSSATSQNSLNLSDNKPEFREEESLKISNTNIKTKDGEELFRPEIFQVLEDIIGKSVLSLDNSTETLPVESSTSLALKFQQEICKLNSEEEIIEQTINETKNFQLSEADIPEKQTYYSLMQIASQNDQNSPSAMQGEMPDKENTLPISRSRAAESSTKLVSKFKGDKGDSFLPKSGEVNVQEMEFYLNTDQSDEIIDENDDDYIELDIKCSLSEPSNFPDDDDEETEEEDESLSSLYVSLTENTETHSLDDQKESKHLNTVNELEAEIETGNLEKQADSLLSKNSELSKLTDDEITKKQITIGDILVAPSNAPDEDNTCVVSTDVKQNDQTLLTAIQIETVNENIASVVGGWQTKSSNNLICEMISNKENNETLPVLDIGVIREIEVCLCNNNQESGSRLLNKVFDENLMSPNSDQEQPHNDINEILTEIVDSVSSLDCLIKSINAFEDSEIRRNREEQNNIYWEKPFLHENDTSLIWPSGQANEMISFPDEQKSGSASICKSDTHEDEDINALSPSTNQSDDILLVIDEYIGSVDEENISLLVSDSEALSSDEIFNESAENGTDDLYPALKSNRLFENKNSVYNTGLQQSHDTVVNKSPEMESNLSSPANQFSQDPAEDVVKTLSETTEIAIPSIECLHPTNGFIVDNETMNEVGETLFTGSYVILDQENETDSENEHSRSESENIEKKETNLSTIEQCKPELQGNSNIEDVVDEAFTSFSEERKQEITINEIVEQQTEHKTANVPLATCKKLDGTLQCKNQNDQVNVVDKYFETLNKENKDSAEVNCETVPSAEIINESAENELAVSCPVSDENMPSEIEISSSITNKELKSTLLNKQHETESIALPEADQHSQNSSNDTVEALSKKIYQAECPHPELIDNEIIDEGEHVLTGSHITLVQETKVSNDHPEKEPKKEPSSLLTEDETVQENIKELCGIQTSDTLSSTTDQKPSNRLMTETLEEKDYVLPVTRSKRLKSSKSLKPKVSSVHIVKLKAVNKHSENASSDALCEKANKNLLLTVNQELVSTTNETHTLLPAKLAKQKLSPNIDNKKGRSEKKINTSPKLDATKAPSSNKCSQSNLPNEIKTDHKSLPIKNKRQNTPSPALNAIHEDSVPSVHKHLDQKSNTAVDNIPQKVLEIEDNVLTLATDEEIHMPTDDRALRTRNEDDTFLSDKSTAIEKRVLLDEKQKGQQKNIINNKTKLPSSEYLNHTAPNKIKNKKDMRRKQHEEIATSLHNSFINNKNYLENCKAGDKLIFAEKVLRNESQKRKRSSQNYSNAKKRKRSVSLKAVNHILQKKEAEKCLIIPETRTNGTTPGQYLKQKHVLLDHKSAIHALKKHLDFKDDEVDIMEAVETMAKNEKPHNYSKWAQKKDETLSSPMLLTGKCINQVPDLENDKDIILNSTSNAEPISPGTNLSNSEVSNSNSTLPSADESKVESKKSQFPTNIMDGVKATAEDDLKNIDELDDYPRRDEKKDEALSLSTSVTDKSTNQVPDQKNCKNGKTFNIAPDVEPISDTSDTEMSNSNPAPPFMNNSKVAPKEVAFFGALYNFPDQSTDTESNIENMPKVNGIDENSDSDVIFEAVVNFTGRNDDKLQHPTISPEPKLNLKDIPTCNSMPINKNQSIDFHKLNAHNNSTAAPSTVNISDTFLAITKQSNLTPNKDDKNAAICTDLDFTDDDDDNDAESKVSIDVQKSINFLFGYDQNPKVNSDTECTQLQKIKIVHNDENKKAHGTSTRDIKLTTDVPKDGSVNKKHSNSEPKHTRSNHKSSRPEKNKINSAGQNKQTKIVTNSKNEKSTHVKSETRDSLALIKSSKTSITSEVDTIEKLPHTKENLTQKGKRKNRGDEDEVRQSKRRRKCKEVSKNDQVDKVPKLTSSVPMKVDRKQVQSVEKINCDSTKKFPPNSSNNNNKTSKHSNEDKKSKPHISNKKVSVDKSEDQLRKSSTENNNKKRKRAESKSNPTPKNHIDEKQSQRTDSTPKSDMAHKLRKSNNKNENKVKVSSTNSKSSETKRKDECEKNSKKCSTKGQKEENRQSSLKENANKVIISSKPGPKTKNAIHTNSKKHSETVSVSSASSKERLQHCNSLRSQNSSEMKDQIQSMQNAVDSKVAANNGKNAENPKHVKSQKHHTSTTKKRNDVRDQSSTKKSKKESPTTIENKIISTDSERSSSSDSPKRKSTPTGNSCLSRSQTKQNFNKTNKEETKNTDNRHKLLTSKEKEFHDETPKKDTRIQSEQKGEGSNKVKPTQKHGSRSRERNSRENSKQSSNKNNLASGTQSHTQRGAKKVPKTSPKEETQCNGLDSPIQQATFTNERNQENAQPQFNDECSLRVVDTGLIEEPVPNKPGVIMADNCYEKHNPVIWDYASGGGNVSVDDQIGELTLSGTHETETNGPWRCSLQDCAVEQQNSDPRNAPKQIKGDMTLSSLHQQDNINTRVESESVTQSSLSYDSLYDPNQCRTVNEVTLNDASTFGFNVFDDSLLAESNWTLIS